MKQTNLLLICILSLSFEIISITKSHNHISDDVNGLMGAFGDFNSDRLTDVFLIADEGKSIELAKGFIGVKERLLQKWPNSLKCEFSNSSDDVIVGVIPSDFTGDARMDLLVVTQEVESSVSIKSEPNFKLWLFTGNLTHLECNTTVPLAQSVKSHPFVLDYNGDMISDFIVESNSCLRELWIHLKPLCLEQIKSNQTISFPNSNAFINLKNTKDLSPDIYFSGTDSIEYWFNNEKFNPGFNSNRMKFIRYPDSNRYKYKGQSSFLDLNFDGIIDHIIPVCKNNINSCEEPEILGLFSDGSEYEWISISNLRRETQNESLLTFTQIKAFNYLELFTTLRVGDIDSDGYPDLVTVLRESNGTKTHAVLLKNVATNDNKFKRKFIIHWISDELLISNGRPNNNVVLVAFLDFYEDGKVDLLISSKDSNNSLYLDAFINNEKCSSNFLKVLVTSGRCYLDQCLNECTCPNGSIAYGTNQFGPFLCFSPSDGDRIGCSGQLSQSAHFALQMPYVIFGLGDIPNFIENLSVSIPSGEMTLRQQTWYEMIPNARIVIIPFPANDSDLWVQKLYLNPSHFTFSTLITFTTICCLLVIIIAFLHKQELREDIAEHKEYKKHFIRD